MSTIALHTNIGVDSIAAKALKGAAKFWFLIAMSGQLMLATYVAVFYGRTAIRGDFEAWNRLLSRGIESGDPAGNGAIVGHLLGAVVLTLAGAIQFIPQLRTRFPRVHRWSGRLYVLFAVGGSLTGLYLTWIRGTRGDLSQHIGGSLNAVLILTFAALAVQTAIRRRFGAHREWVLRLYLMVNASFLYRVFFFLWLMANGGPAGFDPETFTGPALTFFSFANSLIPLAVVELYLRARRAPARLAVAALLIVITVAMAGGIFATTAGMWLPLIRTGQLSFQP
jgi:uncharacterized membrane protein